MPAFVVTKSPKLPCSQRCQRMTYCRSIKKKVLSSECPVLRGCGRGEFGCQETIEHLVHSPYYIPELSFGFGPNDITSSEILLFPAFSCFMISILCRQNRFMGSLCSDVAFLNGIPISFCGAACFRKKCWVLSDERLSIPVISSPFARIFGILQFKATMGRTPLIDMEECVHAEEPFKKIYLQAW